MVRSAKVAKILADSNKFQIAMEQCREIASRPRVSRKFTGRYRAQLALSGRFCMFLRLFSAFRRQSKVNPLWFMILLLLSQYSKLGGRASEPKDEIFDPSTEIGLAWRGRVRIGTGQTSKVLDGAAYCERDTSHNWRVELGLQILIHANQAPGVCAVAAGRRN